MSWRGTPGSSDYIPFPDSYGIDEPNPSLGVKFRHQIGNFGYGPQGFLLNTSDLAKSISPQYTPYCSSIANPNSSDSKSIVWWKAQSIFRGIDYSGNIPTIKKRLRLAGNPSMLQDLVTLKDTAKATYQNKLAAWENLHKAKWNSLSTNAEKVQVDPRRFLEEELPAPRDTTVSLNVAVVETSSDSFVNLVRKLNLASYVISVPQGSQFVQWTIVGQDYKTLTEKHDEVQNEMEPVRRKLWDEQDKQREAEKARQLVLAKRKQALEKPKQKQKQSKENTKKKTFEQLHQEIVQRSGTMIWDVTGTWKISCPWLSKACSSPDKDFTLQIYLQRVSGKQQMFAKFTFGDAVEGIFRFERQSQATTQKTNTKKRKLPEEDEDDIGVKIDLAAYRNWRSPSPDPFRLGPPDKPSPTKPTWKYRWRGNAGDYENVIQPGSDKKAYSITFLGPKGTELSGTFGGGNFESCKFSGFKIKMGEKRSTDVSEEWHSRNEKVASWQGYKRWH